MNDEEPVTLDDEHFLGLCVQLDEAFRRDPSIGAMNRTYRKLRTGRAHVDRVLRDHIGMLYELERARPALLRVMKREETDRRLASSDTGPTSGSRHTESWLDERPALA